MPASGVGAPGRLGRTYSAPHIRLFDERALRQLAEDAGLHVDDIAVDGRDYGPHPRLSNVTETATRVHPLLTNTLVLTDTVAGSA